VDELVLALEGGLDLTAERDQPRQLSRDEALLDRGVERAAERDVHHPRAGP
jgi:hypothetical protein